MKPTQLSLFSVTEEALQASEAPETPETPHLTDPAEAGLDVWLKRLDAWVDAGWLRPLDRAFAQFVSELAPRGSPLTLLAFAVLSHMEGRGHSCLDVQALLDDRHGLLAWPLPAMQALDEAIAELPTAWPAWKTGLEHHAAVLAAPHPDANQPLVMSGSRLYLRRYWQYEQTVAASIRARARHVDLAAGLDANGASGLIEATGTLGQIGEGAARHWLDKLFSPTAPDTAQTEAVRGSADAAQPAAGPNLPPVPPDAATPATDWQKIACAVALRSRVAIITGGPGTGKTYTVARLLALLFATAPDAQRLRIALAAPTGKAAARLKQSIDTALASLQARLGATLPLQELAERIGAARTIHALLGSRPDTRRLRYDAGNPLDIDVLIVDEASMIHLEMMASVLGALPPHARLVLLGDKDQLASVEAGSVLGDLCRDAVLGGYQAATRAYVQRASGEIIPEAFVCAGSALAQRTVMLRESRRFGGPIGQLARAVNAGDPRTCLKLLEQPTDAALQWTAARRVDDLVALCAQRPDDGYHAYLELLRAGPDDAGADAHDAWVRRILSAFDGFRVLCALRDGVWGVTGLNRAIETGLGDAGLIRKRGEWYPGRPVMVTRNDYTVGVFNGDIGIALPAAGARGGLRVYFSDGDALRSVLPTRLSDTETAYAMTVHKAQGSEFSHTVLVLPEQPNPLLTRELIYTGITRARTRFTLVCAERAVFETAVQRKTRRASGLYEQLRD